MVQLTFLRPFVSAFLTALTVIFEGVEEVDHMFLHRRYLLCRLMDLM